MKKIIIAADSFKGTFTSIEAENIIKEEFRKYFSSDIDIELIPVADGGEGTVNAFLEGCEGEKVLCKCINHLGEPIEAEYGILKDATAVIEAASACGLYLSPERKPLYASTHGVGMIILDAVKRGCTNIILGIGGTATTDGGCGLIQFLGGRFFSEKGEIERISSGNLSEIISFDLSCINKKIRNCKITVLCDVKNPLYGENGAAYVFAPQKGADEQQVKFLDSGLRNLGKLFDQYAGRDISNSAGAGAAGGLGAGLSSVFNAQLKSGIDVILEKTDFAKRAENANLVITGEGRLDSQTSQGKVPFGVASLSDKTPVIAICGEVIAEDEEIKAMGIERAFSSNPRHLPFERIKDSAEENLRKATVQAADYVREKGLL